MSTHQPDRHWLRLAQLEVHIDAVSTACRELDGATSFRRRTTIVTLAGIGHVGQGENICYVADVHDRVAALVEALPITGRRTLGQLHDLLDTLDVVPESTETWNDHPNYHRWAIESAALDLALRQAGMSLHEALGRQVRPVEYCLSMGLGAEPSTERVHAWLAHRPGTTFKLDANRQWTAKLCDELQATGAVRVVDIKGHYSGDWVDTTPDAKLYRAIAEHLPDVIVEDPILTAATRRALGTSGMARHAWDAPIHSLDDLRARVAGDRPGAVNIKPSRFGSVRELLATIAWCETAQLPMYGGGQFELDIGRSQLQHLAAIFYPDAANDVAPTIFHAAQPADAVPQSPLVVPSVTGFGWIETD